MIRFAVVYLVAAASIAAIAASSSQPAHAARYNVACIAPNGSWCRIACASDRGVACYANVVNGRCVKRCVYR